MNKRIMSVLLASVLLSVMAVAAIGTATANEIYFNPQAGSAAYDGSTTVDLMVNADDFRSGEVEFTYAAGCIDVTDFDENFADFTNVGWNTGTDGRERITFAAGAQKTGVYRIGTLTIECNSGACDTNLLFDGTKCMLFDNTQEIGATWTDGTFTCGDGPAEDNNIYFDPQAGSATCDGSTTVDLMVAADDFRSGEVEFTYAAGCIDVTDFDENFADFTNVGWNTGTDGRERITFAAGAQKTGVYRIGTLTIECNSGACDTNLLFDGTKCMLFDNTQEISATWTDGTFTCTSQRTYYGDADGDGYGDPANTTEAESAPAGYVEDNTDCDDTNAAVNPGATEVCTDGIDNDCDGDTDCDDSDCIVDADGDGYNAEPCGNDCDDTNAAVNPGATEICDGIDNNCDGQVDEGCCACDFCYDLVAGLNFVSIPKTLVDSPKNATTIFDVDYYSGEFCLYYDASAGSFDLNADVKPCRGYLVYKNAAKPICVDFDDAAPAPSQQLYEGWNMIGYPRTVAILINDDPSPDFASITGLEDDDGNELFRLMATYTGTGWIDYPVGSLTEATPGAGYWIYMNQDRMMSGGFE